ncbi:MAG: hypothetical protein LBJ08_03095 [Bifidobacteriaceae bacterium]|jgi:hypothetical protein|nr:hypothetical protein [Bifidobacteriaceae bacterium]
MTELSDTDLFEPDGPDLEPGDVAEDYGGADLGDNASDTDGPPAPIIWAELSSDELEHQWLTLNAWVEDLRHTFQFPAAVIPPFWHRHQLLVEHLSALRTHWQAAYHPEQGGSGPFGWLRDLDEWKTRMREAVSMLGTRIDQDRTHRLAPWPGEPEPEPEDSLPPVNLDNRYEDLVAIIMWHVARVRRQEDHYYEMVSAAIDQIPDLGTDDDIDI